MIPIATVPTRTGPWYMAWYDDNVKHTLAQKVREACEAYQTRYGAAPTLALVCPGDLAEPLADALVTVQAAPNVQRNTVWIGREE